MATQGPHDKLFKAVFSQPENAAAHFESYLPSEIVCALELSEAKLRSGSFVDEALRERHTDLLYRIPWRRVSGAEERELLLFVLFEHQSTPDLLMPYRMLCYVVRIWESWLQEHPRHSRLPPVLPLVLYHGEQEWTCATELSAMFDMDGVDAAALDALRPFLPNLKLMLEEVASLPDDRLAGRGIVRLALLLLKHGRTRNLLALLPGWQEEFRVEVSRGGPGLHNVRLLVEYLLTVNETVTVDALGDFLAPLGDKAREIPMTVGQQLREEGRKEGRKEGVLLAKRSMARKLLAKGSTPDEVAELTDLPLREVKSLTH